MLDEILNWYGSQGAMAEALGVERPAVSQWIAARKIPPARAIQIEEQTKGRFRAVDIAKI
jgi:DNA-binding transcriptional regulator YdaS (Cro superfamily)